MVHVCGRPVLSQVIALLAHRVRVRACNVQMP